MQNMLKAKVQASKLSQAELARRLENADANIAAAADGFEEWALADIVAAAQKIDNERIEIKKRIREVFRVVHDIKDQGTTFGYPSVTEIAAILCDFMREGKISMSPKQIQVIKLHLGAIRLVLDQRLKGENEAAKNLVKKLTVTAGAVPPLR
ncbi:MAG: Hpt domain-containing protein [Alphaproteobacteria bacterium]